MIAYESLQQVNKEFMDEYTEVFQRVLHGGWYILGKEVAQFEQSFASYCGVEHCIGVASGLDALVLSLRYFGFKPGDEVIVPANTYIASILAIMQVGLKPVLVEPDVTTYNIDPEKLNLLLQYVRERFLSYIFMERCVTWIPFYCLRNNMI
ncbi:DegT/DnrJ/EryC1/StrS family aminotransferase [Sphingobacterium sp. E70]|nr:DegT/DnrJ/EryC1/StrS family aminotransferase [Sphingobacterium sp. E70]ULT22450.1 DegT/DnrJ/EryC1/StrS family aminotransferase [Sphingobacterium sp. E70]